MRARRNRTGLGCIPACAGEAGTARRPSTCRTVHPRVCGGSVIATPATLGSAGASPRVRGKPGLPSSPAGGSGCIPACAGEAKDGHNRHVDFQVHPRVCGGSLAALRSYALKYGASPRVRGKHVVGLGGDVDRGCIPACAGEAESRLPSWAACKVHPRVCGGSASITRQAGVIYGASPRVRGKPRRAREAEEGEGCIPACAGEAPPRSGCAVHLTVHPRVCGGSRIARRWLDPSTGASPRVRGKPATGSAGGLPHRCIPACAGEAPPRRRELLRTRVHPRVCGGSQHGPQQALTV